ncbi:type VI secretion system baseplate subunit TssG [Vibrio algivorus]|uniref:Type VI secretion system baseplate subunit TssG n=1 Tax=Vibrio algivorus TaxID=1667024 RepID=A0A557P5C8_9VIBR|nr:type VI secretion system baseplate subunit TssG [Vibrio algivorus]TVO35870.1 type VI secretion system baseplate subunit TssG [Vibrio algivorus]
MGFADRDAATDLVMQVKKMLPSNVHDFNFYQLVEYLHLYQGTSPEDVEWEREYQLSFTTNPSLGFSPSDIVKLTRLPDEKLLLDINFFGLSGASSPLPGYILEQLVNEEPGGLRKPFFDFFNNRLINLTYRIWRKYRYHIRFQPGAEDEFSSQIFALVGLSDASLRGDTPINWSKMLSYAGLLASKSRSSQVVEGIIAHCFDLQNVVIKEWNKRNVDIAQEQRCILGKQNMTLGLDTVLGSVIEDLSGKFTICISHLSKDRFSEFLPSGCNFEPLRKLVEFVIRDQLAYDIELIMDEEALNNIDGSSEMALGWSSFLGDKNRNSSVLIQGRQ